MAGRDWRAAYERARAASTAWVREDDQEALRRRASEGPDIRVNLGFTCKAAVADRIEQYAREHAPAGLVCRRYEIDEQGGYVLPGKEGTCRGSE